jgi:hypothetical protein
VEAGRGDIAFTGDEAEATAADGADRTERPHRRGQ